MQLVYRNNPELKTLVSPVGGCAREHFIMASYSNFREQDIG
jgi:hypothetical protein